MRRVPQFGRLALMSVGLATVALAQGTANPTVIVIMDSSKSMKEAPGTADSAYWTRMDQPGGDYDCPSHTGDPCVSKFCSAKKVLCDVMGNVLTATGTKSPVVAMGSYYQYVMNTSRPGSATSACTYDVLEPPGLVRTFTSTNDLTQSYTVFPSTKVGVDLSANGGLMQVYGGTKTAVCKSSSSAAAEKYDITKTGYLAGTLNDSGCYFFNSARTGTFAFPIYTGPLNFAASTTFPDTGNCNTGQNYEVGAKRYVTTGIKYQIAAGASCGDGVVNTNASNGQPTGAPTYQVGVVGSIGSYSTCATATSTNCFSSPGTGTAVNGYAAGQALSNTTCNSSFPCDLYLTNVVTNGGRAWYGFYTAADPVQPTASYPLPSATPAYQFSARSAVQGTNTLPLAGQVVQGVGATSCQVGAYNFGSAVGTVQYINAVGGTLTLNDFGITNARATVEGSGAIGLAAAPLPTNGGVRLDETPGVNMTGTTFKCDANWPCDITLTNVRGTTINPVLKYSKDTVCTACPASGVPAPTACTWANTGNDGPYFSVTGTGATVPTCGAFSSTSSPTAAPGGSSWVTNATGFTNAGNAGAPTGCSAASNYTCNFTGNATTLTPSCSTAVSWNGTAPAAGSCAINGDQYSLGTSTSNPTYKYNGLPTDTVSCPAGSTLALAPTAPPGGTWTLGSACSTYPCVLTSNGSTTASGTSSTSTSSPPAGVWALASGPTATASTLLWGGDVGSTHTTASGCSMTGSGTTATVNSPACADLASLHCPSVSGAASDLFGSGSDYLPPTQVKVTPSGAASGLVCGSEGNAQCYMCSYAQATYSWKQNQFTCKYQATKSTYTPKAVNACSYQRPTYNLSDCALRCDYSATAKRIDFDMALVTQCTLAAVETQLQTQTPTYAYSYLTKGGELYGTYTKTLAGSSVCDGTHAWGTDATLTSSCPATLNNCITPANAGTGGVGFTCKLRNSPSDGGVQLPTVTGFTYRYRNIRSQTYADTMTSVGGQNAAYWSGPQANDDPGRVECMAGEYNTYADGGTLRTLAITDDAGVLNRQLNRFCGAAVLAPVETHALVSDWYQDLKTSSRAVVQNEIDPSGITTMRWSKPDPAPKDWGYSLTMDAGVTLASPIFVPIISYGSYSPPAQLDKIKDALRACKLPRIANGNIDAGSTVWDTSTTGFCQADEADREPSRGTDTWSAATDYTPLYGSLKNAGDYAAQMLAIDPAPQCRNYYILLVSDGQEKTPANFGSSDLTRLVSSYRHLTARGHTVDLQTYVVGFAVDGGILDDIASAGGTGSAFVVNDQAGLSATLQRIFGSLSIGTLYRSKPTIATDGSRLYSAYSNTLPSGEYRGELKAYRLNSDGSFTWQWSASPKLNAQTDSSRILKVATGTRSSQDFSVSALNSGTPTLSSLLSGGGLPAGVTATDVVKFARNASLAEPMAAPSPDVRTSRLGRLDHSNPVVVGLSPFDRSWGGSTTAAQDAFVNYTTATQNRGPRVLVGSGDGFLRAFVEGTRGSGCGSAYGADAGVNDADPTCPNGREAWGFMPSDVLTTLVNTRDVTNQPDGVDGQIAVSDVCYAGGGECAQSDWKTIAITGEYSGGKGLFALDISGASDAGLGPSPSYLWGFGHNDLGLTYSTPAIGRVKHNSNERFVAVFGAGRNEGNNTPIVGSAVFVLDALDGGLIREFTRYSTRNGGESSTRDFDALDAKIARPAIHRPPNEAHLFATYVPAVGGNMYAVRFMNSDLSLRTDPDDWMPQVLWDPSSDRNNRDVNGNRAVITQVAVDPDAGTNPPGWKLIDPSSVTTFPYSDSQFPFPVNQVRPLLNRPKVVPVLDSAGKLPDLFFGTGNTLNPQAPGSDPSAKLANWNYFVAVHDTSNRTESQNAGRLMWAHYFLDSNEQVVSEPAVISGGVIVATYLPALTNSDAGCDTNGETTLYCFDPQDGHLTNCLVYMSGSYAGRNTSVLHLGQVGIPSDLLVVNNNLYFATSVGGLMQQSIQQTPPAGDVRSYRRLR